MLTQDNDGSCCRYKGQVDEGSSVAVVSKLGGESRGGERRAVAGGGKKGGGEEEVEEDDEKRRGADEEERGEHVGDEEDDLGPSPRADPKSLLVRIHWSLLFSEKGNRSEGDEDVRDRVGIGWEIEETTASETGDEKKML